MDDTISHLAVNRQLGLSRELTAIANNVANLATTGYRREGVVFAEYLRRIAPDQSLSMADLRARFADARQGVLSLTGGELDLAIEGAGFFALQSADGVVLSRAGAFQRSPEGIMVTPDGASVLDDGGAQVFLPPDATAIGIASDGTVSADGVPVARLAIVDAPAETLQRAGAAAFRPLAGYAPVETPRIRQGALEGSNVDPVSEIARMIEVNRAYEASQGLIDDADDRVRDTISRLGQRA